jgi:hypothetical protein
MIPKAVAGALALAAGGLAALPAQAETIYIGFQDANVNGGAITLKASGPATSGPFFNGSYGAFHITDALGLDTGASPSMPDFGSSVTVATKGSLAAPETITIYVEEAGLTGSVPPFLLGLTANFLSAGWTATESEYVTTGAVPPPPWVAGTLLADHIFTATNVAVAVNATSGAMSFSSPYTLTEKYVITAPASSMSGHALLTENIVTTGVIPEPATWVMMVIGFAGLGYAAFRRNMKSSSLMA